MPKFPERVGGCETFRWERSTITTNEQRAWQIWYLERKCEVLGGFSRRSVQTVRFVRRENISSSGQRVVGKWGKLEPKAITLQFHYSFVNLKMGRQLVVNGKKSVCSVIIQQHARGLAITHYDCIMWFQSYIYFRVFELIFLTGTAPKF